MDLFEHFKMRTNLPSSACGTVPGKPPMRSFLCGKHSRSTMPERSFGKSFVFNAIFGWAIDDQVVAYLAMKGSYIDRMYVDPSEWRKGWGTRLIVFAKSLFPDGLELHTHQENHAARGFYEKHGFNAVKFGTSPPPESVPDVEYHWRPDNTTLGR